MAAEKRRRQSCSRSWRSASKAQLKMAWRQKGMATQAYQRSRWRQTLRAAARFIALASSARFPGARHNSRRHQHPA
jgi:hypothetical protein